MHLEIDYVPRPIFIPYHESTKRFCLTVAHRRAGKTVARINKLIMKAVECNLTDPRFGYLAPFYVQAKDIAWLYVKRYCSPLIELGARINESELSITLPHNNAIIKLYGADNADRMRGLYFDGIVLDECQKILKQVLSQVIMPALADRQGWMDASGTPAGWDNLLGELYKLARNNPEWFLQVLKASETGILPQEELERQKTLMSKNEYEQEFECSFQAAIIGAYYSEELNNLEKDGQVTYVPHNPALQVYTAWDLGMDDATAIWFAQRLNQEVRIIDYYENSGCALSHYAKVLQNKKYIYADHFLPHDVAVRELGTGRSRFETLQGLGLDATVIPAQSVEDGINAVRMLLPRCWFDLEKTSKGMNGLRQYQREYNDKLSSFHNRPRHDWASHPADAFRYMALGLPESDSMPYNKRKRGGERTWASA